MNLSNKMHLLFHFLRINTTYINPKLIHCKSHMQISMLYGLLILTSQTDQKLNRNLQTEISTVSLKSAHPFQLKTPVSQQSTIAEDNFIISLASQDQFDECSLFLFQDKFDNRESVARILSSVGEFSGKVKTAYSIKHSFLQPPVRFPVRVSDYRRRGNPCLIVIFMINDVRSEFVKQIHDTLTPVFIPIMRKDEDFFIFKTGPDRHNDLLQMREFPHKIKFKIAVGTFKNRYGEVEQLAKLKISTVCFFCNPGGTSSLLELPVTELNLPQAGTNYFPDFISDLNGKLLYMSIPFTRAKIEVDYPYEGLSNARRGIWKPLLEDFLMVCTFAA